MKTYKLLIEGKEYEVSVHSADEKKASVSVNGCDYDVEIASITQDAADSTTTASTPAATTANNPAASTPTSSGAAAGGKTIVSPLPGVIISVDVQQGQAVSRGQKVAVIEAMKMENEILAECDGTITAIHVSKGDSVMEDSKIVTIA